MGQRTEATGEVPAPVVVRDVLTQIAREGARRMLAQALEDEVAAYIAAAADERDAHGHRLRAAARRTGCDPVRLHHGGPRLLALGAQAR